MKTCEVILWDVDGTLLNFLKSERYALTQSLEVYHLPVTEEVITRYSVINDSYWKRLERGEMSKKELLRARFEQLFGEFGFKGVPVKDFQQLYQRLLGSVCYYMEDSFELCSSLQKLCRQYVITNGVAVTQRRKLALSGFDRIMEDIFISEELGCEKPSPGFFEACARRIPGYAKEKTLLVGDSLTSDIKGGNLAGIRTVWYNPEGKPNGGQASPELEITSLWQVPSCL